MNTIVSEMDAEFSLEAGDLLFNRERWYIVFPVYYDNKFLWNLVNLSTGSSLTYPYEAKEDLQVYLRQTYPDIIIKRNCKIIIQDESL